MLNILVRNKSQCDLICKSLYFRKYTWASGTPIPSMSPTELVNGFPIILMCDEKRKILRASIYMGQKIDELALSSNEEYE